VLVRGVCQHQLGDDLQPAAVRFAQEEPEVAQCPVGGVDLAVIRDVVAVVAQRRGVEGQQPDGGDAELLDVVELLDQAPEVADPVAVAVSERPHMALVEDGVFVPVRDLPDGHGRCGACGAHRFAPAFSGWCTRKMWAGTPLGSRRTKFEGPCHW